MWTCSRWWSIQRLLVTWSFWEQTQALWPLQSSTNLPCGAKPWAVGERWNLNPGGSEMSQVGKTRVCDIALALRAYGCWAIKTSFLPTSWSCRSHVPVRLSSSTTGILPSRWQWEPDFWSGLCFWVWSLFLCPMNALLCSRLVWQALPEPLQVCFDRWKSRQLLLAYIPRTAGSIRECSSFLYSCFLCRSFGIQSVAQFTLMEKPLAGLDRLLLWPLHDWETFWRSAEDGHLRSGVG